MSRTYIQNGRIYREKNDPRRRRPPQELRLSQSSWRSRTTAVLLGLSVLYILNPANQQSYLIKRILSYSPFRKQPSSDWSFFLKSSNHAAETTAPANYYFFSVQGRFTRSVLHLAGVALECPYDHPQLGAVLCRFLLRDQLYVAAPVFVTSVLADYYPGANGDGGSGDSSYDPYLGAYDNTDYTRSKHFTRIAGLLLLACSLALWCDMPVPLGSHHISPKYNVLGLLLGMDSRPLRPMLSLPHTLLRLKYVIYPALCVLERLIVATRQNTFGVTWWVSVSSYFQQPTDTTMYSVIVMLWIVIAVVTNLGLRQWTYGHHIGMNALAAVAWGYYANHTAANLQASSTHQLDWWSDRSRSSSSPLATVTVSTILCVLAWNIYTGNHNIMSTTVAVCTAHFLGQLLSNYHDDLYMTLAIMLQISR